MTLEQASEITNREIKTHHNGFQNISWSTATHRMEMRMIRRADDVLVVIGEPKAWAFGSEVRKGRPRKVWVENPSVRYLKTLAPRMAVRT